MSIVFSPGAVGLAPMAGVADRAYRILCKEFGADFLISEMISAKGLCYGDPKTADLCTILPQERPMGLQLFGSEPAFMAKAVTLLKPFQPDWIDVNMGCPVHKVITTGAGSALMQTPDLAEAVVSAMAAVAEVPITVKFRLGWDEEHKNAVDFAKRMQRAGASAIAVHGRTKVQLYSGTADWDTIRQVKEAVSIPVAGNGDVTNADTCRDLFGKTHCDAVMIGRGTYGNPFVFSEIAAAKKGLPYTPPTLEKRLEIMLYHIRLILQYAVGKPPELAIREARKHAAWYVSGVRGAAAFRNRCYQLSSYAEAEQLAEEVLRKQTETEVIS